MPHPVTFQPVPPAVTAGLLMEHVGEALRDAADHATVTGLLADVPGRGNGAAFQRAAYRDSGSLAGVVTRAAAATRGARIRSGIR